jgi:AbrB family looped-hinge helix DNA binding protein
VLDISYIKWQIRIVTPIEHGDGVENKIGEQRVFKARIDDSGRIVLPAELRSDLGMSVGDTVTIVKDTSGIHVRTQAQALKAIQDYFQSFVPEDVSLVDELIAERRAEVKAESKRE